MTRRLEGLVSLVTGASAGIGAALARELAREGATVVLAARREDRLRDLARELEAAGGRALAVACDVTRDGDCEAAVARAVEAFGRLDIVVANAGFGVAGSFEKLALDDHRRQMETNVFGLLRTVYAALPELKRNRGRLALIGSVAGRVAFPGASAYSASKFAVTAYARALRHELRAEGVSVTLVSPGFVESEIALVDNRGVFRAEREEDRPRLLLMPAAVAARKIVRAIARRRAEAVITLHGKLVVFVERHFPWLVSAVLALAGRKARRAPKT